jgi:hypothetical protein
MEALQSGTKHPSGTGAVNVRRPPLGAIGAVVKGNVCGGKPENVTSVLVTGDAIVPVFVTVTSMRKGFWRTLHQPGILGSTDDGTRFAAHPAHPNATRASKQ